MNCPQVNFTRILQALAISIFVLLIFLGFSQKSFAAAGINRVINFQGKVVTKTTGLNVANGNYDFTFKLYDAASAGTLIWTENFNTANGNQLTVTDGIFRAALGSVCVFSGGSCQGNTNTAVDFNSDTLYLDITFNGETMGSRIQFTSVPYALNAEKVSGLTVTNNGGNTLNIAANKTLTVSNSLTLAGTDAKTLNIGANNLTFTTSGDTTLTLPTTGTVCVNSNNCGYTTGTIFWKQTAIAGAITPINSTLDLLVGGDTTASARFAVFNIAGALTPTASISAGTNGASSLTAAGTLATTAKQTLTLGDANTGEVVLAPGGTTALIGRGANLIAAGTLTGLTGFTLASGGITLGGTTGTSAQCLLGGATAAWGSCGGGGGGSNWTLSTANGVLSPNNNTLDLLIGGTTTASAKFAFINVAGGTPTASVAGDLTLGNSGGIIRTTKLSTLQIGDTTTGDISFKPKNIQTLYLSGLTGRIGAGTVTNPVGIFNISGDAGNNATLILNNTGAATSDLFTASASGTSNFTISNSGAVTTGVWNGTALTDAYVSDTLTSSIFIGSGSTTNAVDLATAEVSGILPTANGGSFWNSSSGALYPGNSTLDLLVGGTTSTSAKFAVLNVVGSGTPTASLSAGTAGGAYLTAAGNLQTTAFQTLSLGGGTTGDISFKPKNIQTLYLSGLTGRIGAGTVTSPVGLFNISGNAGNNATLILNNTGASTSDLFTASASGATKFSITNGGNLVSVAGAQWLPLTDSRTALQIANAAGTSMLNFDTINTGINATSSATTTDAFSVAANSLTAGKGLNVLSTSANLTSANLLNADHTATYVSTLNDSGNLLNLNRALTSGAAITWLVSSTGGFGSSSPFTDTLTVPAGSNRLLIMSVGNDLTTSNVQVSMATPPTYGGVPFTAPPTNCQVNTGAGDSNPWTEVRNEIWYMPEAGIATASSTTVSITMTTGIHRARDFVEVYSNVNQATPFNGNCATNTGNNNHPVSGTITSAANELVFDTVTATASGSFTAESPVTKRGNSLSVYMQYNGDQPGGSPNKTNTWSATAWHKWADVGVSIKPAAPTLTLSGALANLTSNCSTAANGICTDTANILSLTQSNTGASGAVLKISNSSTNATGYGLHVLSSASQTATYSALFESQATGATSYGIAVKLDFTGNTATTNRWIDFMSGLGRSLGKIRGGNNIAQTAANTVVYDANGGDYAEYYKKADPNENIDYGDAVCLAKTGGVTKCSPENNALLGVMSYTAGFVGNGGHDGDPNYILVGIVGQLEAKVASDSAVIEPSNPVTISTTDPGKIQKATGAGFILGRALGDYNPSQVNIVSSAVEGKEAGKVKINLLNSWYDPNVYITADGNVNNPYAQFTSDQVDQLLGLISPRASGSAQTATPSGSFDLANDPLFKNLQDRVASVEAQIGLSVDTGNSPQAGLEAMIRNISPASSSAFVSELFSDRVAAGLETVTPHVITKTIDLENIHAATISAGLTLAKDGTFAIKDDSGNQAIIFDDKGNAFFAGTLTVDKIRTNQIEGLEFSVRDQLLSMKDLLNPPASPPPASPSGNFDILGDATSSAQTDTGSALDSKLLTLSSLDVEGLATVSANLRVKGSGLIEGILTVIDTLTTHDFITTGIANFFGDVIFKQNVSFEGPVTFSNDLGGSAVVKKDARRVEVVFDNEFEKLPIVNASVSFEEQKDGDGNVKSSKDLEEAFFSNNYAYVIVDKSNKGFTIVLNKDAKEDVSFTWTALRVKDAKNSQSK